MVVSFRIIYLERCGNLKKRGTENNIGLENIFLAVLSEDKIQNFISFQLNKRSLFSVFFRNI